VVDTFVAVLRDRVGIDAAGLPEREVRRIALLGAFVGIALRLDLAELLIREFTVLVEAAHVEVDRAVGLVGVALLDQCLDEVDDLGDVLGDAG